MYSRVKYKLLSYWCQLVGHRFQSNHVGAIRCVRCHAPWPVTGGKE